VFHIPWCSLLGAWLRVLSCRAKNPFDTCELWEPSQSHTAVCSSLLLSVGSWFPSFTSFGSTQIWTRIFLTSSLLCLISYSPRLVQGCSTLLLPFGSSFETFPLVFTWDCVRYCSLRYFLKLNKFAIKIQRQLGFRSI
jgi:hypothetical protein